MALILQNRETPRSYRIENSADEATVYLYDVIDEWYGVSAAKFAQDLAAITAPTIHLRVNSPGGDVFAGRAMATALQAHPSKVVAHVDGLAASAASYVALAADEVEIAQGAFVMIHRAWGFTVGNAEDHLTQAALLEKIDAELVADYARQTGNDAEQIKAWLDEETWFTAEEAVQHGFADRLAEPAKAAARWNLVAFEKAPEATATPDTTDDEADFAHADRLRRLALV